LGTPDPAASGRSVCSRVVLGAYVLIDGTIALIAAFTCGAKPAPAGRSLWAPAGGIRSDLALGVYSIVFGILLLGCRAPRSEGQGGWGDLQLIQS